MGYSIIFETKFVRLNDGRYLHLARSGCNNDKEGRKRGIFRCRGIFAREEIESRAMEYISGSKSHADGGPFELKIQRRDASFHDYGRHLMRMLRAAKSYDRFIQNRTFWVRYVESVDIIKPYCRNVSPEKFQEIYLEAVRNASPLSWLPVFHICDISSEDEIVKAIEEGRELEFFIGIQKRTK